MFNDSPDNIACFWLARIGMIISLVTFVFTQNLLGPICLLPRDLNKNDKKIMRVLWFLEISLLLFNPQKK